MLLLDSMQNEISRQEDQRILERFMRQDREIFELMKSFGLQKNNDGLYLGGGFHYLVRYDSDSESSYIDPHKRYPIKISREVIEEIRDCPVEDLAKDATGDNEIAKIIIKLR